MTSDANTVPPIHTRPENRVWRDLRRAQDDVTDAVTAFAGSLTFVYLHVGLDPAEIEAHVQRLVAQARVGLVDGSATDIDPAVI